MIFFRPHATIKLYDMSGNVDEWCWDWWPASNEYSADAATDPCGDPTGFERVFRGRCYIDRSGDCAVYWRDCCAPDNQNREYLGFRVCRTVN